MSLTNRIIGILFSICGMLFGLYLFQIDYGFMGFLLLCAGLIAIRRINRNTPVNMLIRYIASYPNENLKLYYSILNTREDWEDNPKFKMIAYNGFDKIKSSGQEEKYVEYFNKLFPNEPELMNGQINKSSVEKYAKALIRASNGLSPEDINKLLSKSLELNVEDYNSLEKISKEYNPSIFLYEITHGKMPNVPSAFLLNKNEQCVFSTQCFAFEQKQVTSRVNYAGPRARIKIAKGLSYNVGSYKVSSNKTMVQVPKGSGPLNLTNKRILFKGADSSLAIPLTSIIDMEEYSDGIVIKKGSGNPLVFKFIGVPKFKILFEVIREGNQGLN